MKVQDNQDEDRRIIDNKRFKFDATVNIAHIVATISMVVMLFSWGSTVNADIAIGKVENQRNKEAIERIHSDTMVALQEINRKLDNLSMRDRKHGE